jgi:hypothetical protein
MSGAAIVINGPDVINLGTTLFAWTTPFSAVFIQISFMQYVQVRHYVTVLDVKDKVGKKGIIK